MESFYDLRPSRKGDWEVFNKKTGAVAVIGGLSLSELDRSTANGVVGLLNKNIIGAGGTNAEELSGRQDIGG